MQPRTTTAFLMGLFVFSQLLFPANAAPTRAIGRSVSLAPAAPSAAASQGLAFAGRVGGMPSALATNGTHVYAGQDADLTVVDVGNPVAPGKVGKSSLTGVITKLVVIGNRLYVAAGKLYVLDITNPAAPAVMGSIDLGGNLGDLAIAGSYAYTIVQAGLMIVDVANPAAPRLVGRYSSEYMFRNVAVSGQYAYLGASLPVTPERVELEIVAVAYPAHPTLARRDDVFGRFDEIVFFGSYGLVARDVEGLDVISVADPIKPIIVAHRNTNASNISIVGSRAYIADTDPLAGGLRIFDITDPTNLVEQGFYASPDVIRLLAGTGRYAYLFDTQEGYSIVDALDPAAPQRVGLLRDVIHPGQVAVQNSYAFVAESPIAGSWKQPNGVKIVDISNIGDASVVGVYRPAGTNVNTLTIAGDYAYVGTRTDVLTDTGTLNIVNVADPAHPAEVAVYRIPGATWIAMGPIVILDHYAYVGDHTKVHVVDVADPAHPQLVGSYSPAHGGIDCIAGQNGYIYVGVSHGSSLDGSALEIVDISNPAAPTKVGAIETQNYAIDIAVAGQYAYMVSGLQTEVGALHAIDISDPASPKLASRFDLDAPGQVFVTAKTAYLTHPYVSPGGVSVLDISDPYHMRQTGFYETDVTGNSAIDGEFVYIPSNDLLILKAVTLTTRSYLPQLNRM